MQNNIDNITKLLKRMPAGNKGYEIMAGEKVI